MFVSPAEPPIIKTLGTVNLKLTEAYGADVLWHEPIVGGLIGVQRKEIKDLFNSVGDGRLQREKEQLRQCAMGVFVIEGRPVWVNGEMTDGWSRWTRDSYRGLCRSIQGEGYVVEYSDDEYDTVTLIQQMAKYYARADHDSLNRRPKPTNVGWGTDIGEEGWACHFLQSFDGIGPKQAKAIYAHFGGKIPFIMSCSLAELEKVPGLGPKKAAAIGRVFGVEPEVKAKRVSKK